MIKLCFKKFLSLLLSFLLIFPCVRISTVTVSAAETKNITNYLSSDPAGTIYEISTPHDLNYFASLVNDNGVTFSNYFINLTNDITFDKNTENNFIPIGIVFSSPFQGTFDGKGFSISGINVNFLNFSPSYAGLFSYINNGAIVKNINLTDSIFSSNTITAGIVAFNQDSTVENCTLSSTSLNSPNFIGGIVGENASGAITSCINSSNITSSTANFIGGITSKNAGDISVCYNSGDLIGSSACEYIGGICAANNSDTLSNCYNIGSINGNGAENAGGISGVHSNVNEIPLVSMQNCYNAAQVNNATNTGSVVGLIRDISNTPIIINSYYLKGTAPKGIGLDETHRSSVIELTSSKMATDAFAYNLNTTNSTESPSGVWTRENGINNGYPIFKSINLGAIYELTIKPNVNGSISYNNVSDGITYVKGNSIIQLDVTPDSGYSLISLIINNTTQSNTTGVFTMPNANTTVQPVFNTVSYSITANLNGGRLNTGINIPDSYNINDLPIQLPNSTEISKTGYTFAGWYLTPDFSGSAISKIPVGTTGNISIYARWSPITYIIDTYLNGGSLNSDVTIPTNFTVNDLPITLPDSSQISRKGYTFNGWFTTQDFIGNPITEIPVGSAEDISIYAKWSTIEYDINAELNGGTIISGPNIPSSYNITDLPIDLPNVNNISKKDNTFSGWYLTPDFSGNPVTKIQKGTTGPISIYAKWTLDQYAFTAELNGGTLNSGVTIPSSYNVTDLPIILPTANEISKAGYNFDGWFTTPSFSESPIYEIPAGTTGHVFIYAKWTAIEYNIVTNLNGGILNPNITIPTSYNVTNLPIPLPKPSQISKRGYTFEGWYLNSNFSGDAIYEILPGTINNISLYAKWSLTEYDITAYFNRGILNKGITIPLFYNIEQLPITLPNNTEILRTGYTFNGWFTTPNFIESPLNEIPVNTIGNLFIYAKWSPTEYSITTNLNGGSLKDGVSIPNSYNITTPTITLPTSNEIYKKGYTFDGWFTSPIFIGNAITKIPIGSSGDVTLYAKWTKEKSKISKRNIHKLYPTFDSSFKNIIILSSLLLIAFICIIINIKKKLNKNKN